ncbi:PREDICTED: uncharacterized protein LOC104743721 [Camelina sativa]|uniref:Uncharacterized protein LOC104743721 n=1 Tax=Camelina sativa TaxID=90675 RepID=A0ABM0VYH1_CAMSA|nr:PREDICTED: uncharacterized protein LOC104743721 [Camelina sativa]
MKKHRYMVRNVDAVPSHTKNGIGFNCLSSISDRHVHHVKVAPPLGSKRFRNPRKVSFKPSKPSLTVKVWRSKSDPVRKELNQEVELFGGSVTMGAAPSPRHVPIPIFLRRSSGRVIESTKLTMT